MDATNLKKSVDDLGDRVRPKVEAAKERVARVNDRMKTFIQDHPAACLLGAIALGYVVARLARNQR